jgi:hypothetical protein
MRKFLMAAGLLALVACGDKNKPADAGNTMAPTAAPAMTMADSLKADSLKKDSIMKDSVAKAGAMTAPKKP